MSNSISKCPWCWYWYDKLDHVLLACPFASSTWQLARCFHLLIPLLPSGCQLFSFLRIWSRHYQCHLPLSDSAYTGCWLWKAHKHVVFATINQCPGAPISPIVHQVNELLAATSAFPKAHRLVNKLAGPGHPWTLWPKKSTSKHLNWISLPCGIWQRIHNSGWSWSGPGCAGSILPMRYGCWNWVSFCWGRLAYVTQQLSASQLCWAIHLWLPTGLKTAQHHWKPAIFVLLTSGCTYSCSLSSKWQTPANQPADWLASFGLVHRPWTWWPY